MDTRHRGLLQGVLAAAAVALPVLTWWRSVGNPIVYFTYDLPPGQSLFAFAKLFGLIGIVLLWAQALLGLAPRVRALAFLPKISRKTHARLGLLATAIISLHVALFVVGSSLRKKEIAWDLLLPNFSHGFYFVSITLGAFAFYLLAIVLFAGWRTNRGSRAWKKVHVLWGGVFLLALLHSLFIGSESRFGLLAFFFYFIAASIAISAVARFRAWFLRSTPESITGSG